MNCMKCHAEWTTNTKEKVLNCPFCGEPLMENIPYQKAVDAFRVIIDRFGIEIYSEEKRLFGMLNDILPNTSKEKNILKMVISLCVPRLVATVVTECSNRVNTLKKGYELLENGGLSDTWCAASLYILSMPLGIDSTDLYPLKDKVSESDIDTTIDVTADKEQMEEKYSEKTLDELITLALKGDVVAETELGERYYSGIGTEEDIDAAIACFTHAADTEYPVAEFILGKLYDEGQSVPHNSVKAFEYYQKSANRGYPQAQYALGQMYYFGHDCEKNDSEALYWILKAMEELEDSDIYVLLSMLYKDSDDDNIRDEGKAFEFARKAAEMGDENAYNILGSFYEMGYGVEQSYEQAFQYYKLAAENGVVMAYLNIGAFYQEGIAVPKDERKAAEYFQYGANTGDMYCLNALGMCYKNGIGVPQDYKKAFELFLDAAYAGNFAAELNTGLAYDKGEGVEENKSEAKKWFTLAAEHGISKAMVTLGFYMEKGIPEGEPDLEKAFEWYLKAAEVGDHPFATLIVGNCYSRGLMGVKIDRCTAFEWYLKAAKLGQPTAQNNVACDYIKGEIVDLDYEIATKWFEKAVEQEDMYALNNYGILMLNGDGIPRNTERAFSMIKKSAEMGYLDAQCNLGACYFEGWGTTRNLDEALKWLVIANDSGDDDALAYLQKGFKEKNGVWRKRGVLGYVPAPEQLPAITEPTECKGGCGNFCEYANMIIAEKLYKSDIFCYCKFLDEKVFKKAKCPYYKMSALLRIFED